MTKTIRGFFGRWRWLSNFWPAEVWYQGVTYPTVEHAYQAAKTVSPIERQVIRACPTPGGAKRLGKGVNQREDWDTVKIPIMLNLLRQKFAQEPLRSRLLATESNPLIEENPWGDRFWGISQGEGHNMLGRLLMQIRDEL